MNTNLRKELPVLLIALLPAAYLVFIWNSLPATVPIHWNANGQIDDYGSKKTLIWLALLLPLPVYIIMSVVPKIDPKGKLKNMGNKLQSLKFLITLFMSLAAIFILYSTKQPSLSHLNLMLMAIGVLYVVLGNYFKTIRPNYFIGIKTPWALENEDNWKQTHVLAGKFWFWGGLLVILTGLFVPVETYYIVFLAVTAVLVLVPFVYSFWLYRQQKQAA